MGLLPSYFNKKLNAETKQMCEKMNALKIDERNAAFKYISKLHPKVNMEKQTTETNNLSHTVIF
jgi:hypothetical protein